MRLFSRKKETKLEKEAAKDQKRRDKAEAKALKAEAKASKASTTNTNNLEGYSRIVRWRTGTKTGWCSGCHDHIGALLDGWKNNGCVVSSDLTVPFVFHESFEELDRCCELCISCRVFRQALLLRQASNDTFEVLGRAGRIRAALVRLDDNSGRGGEEVLLKVLVGNKETYATTAVVACTLSRKVEVDYLELTPFPNEVISQVPTWLTECKQHHGRACGRLNWSSRNPTRLIEITSPTKLRLIEGSTLPPRSPYMALSYVWGGITTSNTLMSNVQQRVISLPTTDLLATQQDALVLARQLGVNHVWIDAICIVQDSPGGLDWSREAARMHEYYGNALFTLYVSSGLRADEGFLHFRQAWKYKQLDCDIGGVRLLNVDTALEEARKGSPHATRGWTLQEEYLSPRRLYWFREGMYWSCAAEIRAEGITASTRRPGQDDRLEANSQLLGRFLLAAFKRHTSELHEIWLSVVESYARRNLTQPADKFKAIMGVASRCWNDGDRYLAGLWARTIAVELVWKLEAGMSRAPPPAPTHPDAPTPVFMKTPSWSWASLPANSLLQFHRDFKQAADFALLESSDDGVSSTAKDEANEHIERGALVQHVIVKGRVRNFWSKDAKLVGWDEVSSPLISPIDPLSIEDISFGAYRGDDAYSVSIETGRIAVAEKRTEEIVGQLDYVEDAALVAESVLEVECLEVGSSAMLLVSRVSGTENVFRRVGACHEVREDFFSGHPCVELVLQ
jgi:hypothetical protein